jgi:hypothetical protein
MLKNESDKHIQDIYWSNSYESTTLIEIVIPIIRNYPVPYGSHSKE